MTAKIGLERHVEELDKNPAHIVAHPLLEDIHQEAAVLFAADRSPGYQVAGLGVEQTFAAGLLTPAQVCYLNRLFSGALDDRDKLHPLSLHLVAEEAIDRTTVFLIGGIDRAQDVELDSVLAQAPPALHHFVESALFGAVHPVRVVELTWAVNAQANQKIVFLEEGTPLIIKKDAVGLKGMFDGLLGPAILFDELDGAPKEVKLHQRRLAPLPRHGHRGRAVRL